jgi:hypothetical protein
MLDDRGSIPGRGKEGIFLFVAAHPAFYPMGTTDFFAEGTAAGSETDKSPPSSTEIKNASSYISTPPYVFMA